MIKSMYDLGIPLETIAKASKLSVPEVEHILGHKYEKSLNCFKLFSSTWHTRIFIALKFPNISFKRKIQHHAK